MPPACCIGPQTRTNETRCADTKFDKIQETCTGPLSLRPYGVDPVFKLGTTLYDPDYDDVEGRLVLSFYNCSKAARQTYDLLAVDGTVVNREPYCAELYNPQNLPYAFYHFPMQGRVRAQL
jgi:hypothetical protein